MVIEFVINEDINVVKFYVVKINELFFLYLLKKLFIKYKIIFFSILKFYRNWVKFF